MVENDINIYIEELPTPETTRTLASTKFFTSLWMLSKDIFWVPAIKTGYPAYKFHMKSKHIIRRVPAIKTIYPANISKLPANETGYPDGYKTEADISGEAYVRLLTGGWLSV